MSVQTKKSDTDIKHQNYSWLPDTVMLSLLPKVQHMYMENISMFWIDFRQSKLLLRIYSLLGGPWVSPQKPQCIEILA